MSTASRTSTRRFRTLLAVGAVVAMAAPLVPLAASASLRTPHASVALPVAVDAPASYDPATICSPTAKPGTLQLQRLLLTTYPTSRSLGITRACGSGGKSEHKEGRAFDWGNRAWVPNERANVESFIAWALATDSHGNAFANARRLGVMYLIWDDHIWSPGQAAQGWRPYLHAACKSLATCSNTYRHRDHMHISLSWDGARARTSFWTGKVLTPVTPTPTPWPSSSAPHPTATPHPTVTTHVTLTPRPTVTSLPTHGPKVIPIPTVKPRVQSGGVTNLNAFRSTVLRRGSTGRAVTALQKSLRMTSVTGTFGPITQATVRRYQKAHRIPQTGVVANLTWTALQSELNRESRSIVLVKKTPVRLGSRGTAAKTLEHALNRAADGRISAVDVSTLKVFQRLHGLKADGVVGSATWSALRGV